VTTFAPGRNGPMLSTHNTRGLVPPKMACEGTILVVPKTTLTEIDPARAAETLLYGLNGGTVSANAAATAIAQQASDDMDAVIERNHRHMADREDVVAEVLAERPPHTASDF